MADGSFESSNDIGNDHADPVPGVRFITLFVTATVLRQFWAGVYLGGHLIVGQPPDQDCITNLVNNVV